MLIIKHQVNTLDELYSTDTSNGIEIDIREDNQDIVLAHDPFTKNVQDKIKLIEILPFFENIASHLSEAQLIISRSGASSVADIGVVGRPSILVPLGSAIRDEQTLNAAPLKKVRAAKVIAEQNLTVKRLNTAILKILSSPENASKMAANAHKTVVLDATKKLADRVEEISGYNNR